MKKRDILIVLAVLVLAGALFAGGRLLSGREAEDRVNIYLGTQIYKTVPLHEDAVVEVKQDDGKINHIEIKGGVVRMRDANCSNQDCVHMGSMSAEDPGLMFGVIVCLPHQVSVELRLAGEEQ